ncbi:MAG: hypothetical protein J7K46_00320 [Bacteroidales bacterium]|nr:hypothetical protein [Bacteroidales bacterium]
MVKSFSFLALFSVLGILLLSAGCGSSNMSLNSAKKTNDLKPGMTYDEVVSILGKPKSSRFENSRWINRWVLQEMWVGYVPYDMVFDPQTKKLLSWSRNEKDFQKKQENLKAVVDAVEEVNSQSGEGNAAVNGPNDVNLQRQFAIKLYRFSAVGGGQTGGTETVFNLCPNGTFYKTGETGYSGEGWGSASRGAIQADGTFRAICNRGRLLSFRTGKHGNTPTPVSKGIM